MPPATPATPVTPRRKPGRPKAADTLHIQAHIIAVAKRLFDEHGIASVGMEAVAQAANITKQTLYARFPNKDELYLAVIHDLMQQWRVEQGPLVTGDDTLEEALVRHTLATLETATREGSGLLDHFLSEQAGRNPALARDIIGPIRSRAIHDIELILTSFLPPGQASAGAIHAAAEYYFMCLTGKIHDLHVFREENQPAAIADWARCSVALFLRGFPAA